VDLPKLDSGSSARLRAAVRNAYSAAATAPADTHPFPVGRGFAESLGYPAHDLAQLPAAAVDAFTGVSSVSVFADLQQGKRVLDLGCGAGLDSLLAARRVGQSGRVIGADFSAAMLKRAREAVAAAGVSNIIFCRADAENLPLKSGAIDVTLINGIFNLNPAREALFAELARIMRPRGSVYAAELILTGPLPVGQICPTDDNWFAWIAGAKEGGVFLDEFRAAGFREVVLLRAMRNARTRNPGVLAAEVRARR
jgi:arsenite methyltransferase